jgi:hypothetical protein
VDGVVQWNSHPIDPYDTHMTKSGIVDRLHEVVSELRHAESDKQLDHRL